MNQRYRVEITAAVRRQLGRIHDYIAGEGAPLAAHRMIERIIEAVDSLAEAPERGKPAGPRHRELIVGSYIVRYRVDGSIINVVRIRHAARRPD